MYSKIWLSKPHFEKEDFEVFKETIVSNWVSTVGPNIASFEKSIESVMVENSKVVALNSGTSAIHLALKLLEIGSGDEVLCQTFTFCASTKHTSCMTFLTFLQIINIHEVSYLSMNIQD